MISVRYLLRESISISDKNEFRKYKHMSFLEAITNIGSLINFQSGHNLQHSFNLYQERVYATQENWNQLI